MKRLSRLLGFVLLLTASSTFATHHSWKMAEVFSNLDGTLQFVELISIQNGHSELSCCFLVAGNAETGVDKGFKPTDLSTTVTNGHSLLFASVCTVFELAMYIMLRVLNRLTSPTFGLSMMVPLPYPIFVQRSMTQMAI